MALGDLRHHDHEAATRNDNHPKSEYGGHKSAGQKDKRITIASTAKLAPHTVERFLARHIPDQYAPLGGLNSGGRSASKDPNSKFCYRHRPDTLCRRQADEPSMDKMQKVSIMP